MGLGNSCSIWFWERDYWYWNCGCCNVLTVSLVSWFVKALCMSRFLVRWCGFVNRQICIWWPLANLLATAAIWFEFCFAGLGKTSTWHNGQAWFSSHHSSHCTSPSSYMQWFVSNFGMELLNLGIQIFWPMKCLWDGFCNILVEMHIGVWNSSLTLQSLFAVWHLEYHRKWNLWNL